MMETRLSIHEGHAVAVMPANWPELKRQEIANAERALEAMKTIGTSPTSLGRLKSKITFLKRWLAMLESGFIPMPTLELSYEFSGSPEPGDRDVFRGKKWRGFVYLNGLPVKALEAIAAIKAQGLFDRIGIVSPRRQRDPLIIGVIREGRREAHFLIAWWLPELIPPWELQ